MEESVTIQEFLTYYRQCMRLEPVDENSYSPLVLAYIGDSVYEVIIRTKVINRGSMQVNKMHKQSSELVKAADESGTREFVSYMKTMIEELCDVLGIITEKKEEVLDSEIEEMIEARQQARKDRNFALADEIRGKLLDMGIVLEDTREGVKWKRA